MCSTAVVLLADERTCVTGTGIGWLVWGQRTRPDLFFQRRCLNHRHSSCTTPIDLLGIQQLQQVEVISFRRKSKSWRSVQRSSNPDSEAGGTYTLLYAGIETFFSSQRGARARISLGFSSSRRQPETYFQIKPSAEGLRLDARAELQHSGTIS